MIALAFALALAVSPTQFDGGGRIVRHHAPVVAFMRQYPCPTGSDAGSARRCRGFVVDHRCPLACGGPDEPTNMQWQSVREAEAKDRWERTAGGCAYLCSGVVQ